MRDFEKWLIRIDYIKDEYPFGPLQVLKDQAGLMHCADGPAYISPTRVTWYKAGRKHGLDVDKFGSIVYYYEGILVPGNYVTSPESLTVKEVFKNPNAEVKYVGIKILGYEKVKDIAKIIDIDKEEEMELFRVDKIFEEPIMILKVKNSTPEKDNSFKNYYLTVPPEMKSCKEAVAWTFYKDTKVYKPKFQT